MAKCPRCGNLLREVLVHVSPANRTAVEACLDGCVGIWVGSEDLNAGLQPVDSEELLALQQGSAGVKRTRWDFLEVEEARRGGPKIVLTAEQVARYINCVRCGREMRRYRWNATSPVLLDECPDGHGIWIDAGEIMAMRQFTRADTSHVEPSAQLRARLAKVQIEHDLDATRRPGRRGGSLLDWLLNEFLRGGDSSL